MKQHILTNNQRVLYGYMKNNTQSVSDNKTNNKTNNKINNYIGNAFLLVMALQFLGCFLFQAVNEVAARFTSLASFLLLGIIAMTNLQWDLNRALKDREFLIMAAGCIVALLNLFIIHSNKGAFLTAADVLLAFYCMRFFRLTKCQRFIASGFGVPFLIWWYCTVRWEYNFNMVGIIFMITAVMTILMLQYLRENQKLEYLIFVQVVLYITATLLCLLYHARCVLAGMLVFGILYMLMPYLCRNRIAKWTLVLLSTIGSIVFTGLYILMDKAGISITILYKNILSGRQDIWGELWRAFGENPITGIGSSYKIKSFFIFEVHNGLLDILIVHGILVFAAVIFLMIKRLCELLEKYDNGTVRIALSGIFAILFTSFFENFFINSPYLLVVLFLAEVAGGENKS